MSHKSVQLWSDEPAHIDLLAFGAVAETVVEAVLDDSLDPVALGISGPWGSGKSTVLKLIEADLELLNPDIAEADDQDIAKRILIVNTDPWRYDPDVGAKATLILQVLDVLGAELAKQDGITGDIEGNLKKLVKRVNWVKALKLAARTSITLQLPGIEDLSSLVNEEAEGEDPEPRNLDEFRKDFAELMSSEYLSHIRRVVVLVDDLDRCLPDTVIDTLETMRLFLSVPKMSFVIAADEERVADALRTRYPANNDSSEEEPARLYLHKIVQTTLRLPALSRFDTETYLILLLLQAEDKVSDEQFDTILQSCTSARIQGGSIDAVEFPDGLDASPELEFAARLTPILYEKLKGSPRRIKRFLNDLNVRSSIAERRGITLEVPIFAKLMVLEVLLYPDFENVLDWLAAGELREKLARLETEAGQLGASSEDGDGSAPTNASDPDSTEDEPDDTAGDQSGDGYSENLIRWAKLPPSLRDVDLNPYLHLAASFAGKPLVDSGLPERLRDVAANMLSANRVAQKSVTDADLAALPTKDAADLTEHLGRMARDRPTDLIPGISGLLRMSAARGDTDEAVHRAIKSIPAKVITAPAVMLFGVEQAQRYKDVLASWSSKSTENSVKSAIALGLKSKAAK